MSCLQRPLAPQLRHVWMTYLLRQATPTTPFRLVMAFVAALLCSLAGGSAGSPTNRTIKIVVAVPPGGNTDIVARVLADQIGRAHGPAMVIENRPGAGSAIATEAGSGMRSQSLRCFARAAAGRHRSHRHWPSRTKWLSTRP
jgi:hypothetical protein